MAKIKVSQKTIDKIKEMGMTAALKKAPNASPEMKEALTRMYGARRVAAAGGKSTPAAKSADAARGASTKASAKPVYKSADAARSAMPGKGPMASMGTKMPGARPVRTAATNPAAKAVVNILSGRGLKANDGMTAAQVAAENKRRASGVTTPSKPKPKATIESVAATNAKRMGISVAEYNKRLAAAKKK